jgi:hypothetical protein
MLLDLGRCGFNRHAVLALPRAGRRQYALADVDDAHAADSRRGEPRIVTERGNFDSRLPGGFPDRRPVRNIDPLTVNRHL